MTASRRALGLVALVLATLCLTVSPPARAAAPPRTLVLYATSGPWGRWGEIYATFTANLVGRFGTYDAEPVSAYRSGQIEAHAATIYIGSSYGEALPPAFLSEALATHRPLMWLGYGVEALVGTPAGHTRFGWTAGAEDMADLVKAVAYRGEQFTRRTKDNGGLVDVRIDRPGRVQVLATAIKTDGRTAPWAVRSDNLFYVAENPFPYMNENDRYVVFADLLFDLLAPQTAPRRRALVRIEDVGPFSEPDELRAVADFLASEKVPFSVSVYDSYRDPTGHESRHRRIDLVQAKAVVAALRYMQARGGTLIMHGHTHQFQVKANPYSAVSADDFEFFFSHLNRDGYVVYDGPVRGDSEAWAQARLEEGLKAWSAAGLARPTIFEFPHYAGSAADYQAVSRLFSARYDRALYFGGVLSGRPADPRTWAGQFFPYPVTDIYGARVIPENLGNHEPVGFNHNASRLPADILATARRDLVTRDAFASFFHHPFLDIALLKETVRGLKAEGYVFVTPDSVLADP